MHSIHIVDGGRQNELLCQLTVELTGVPVIAGPVEATALGNLAVQAPTAGLLPNDLDALRRASRQGLSLRTYEPSLPTGTPGGDPTTAHLDAERMLAT